MLYASSFFRPNYIFDKDAYFLDFFFNVNPIQHPQVLHFGVLNYEKQHKEDTCKVSGRAHVFSAFYADFCLCPKLVIITTLIEQTVLPSSFFIVPDYLINAYTSKKVLNTELNDLRKLFI